jgi:hypothetical protein
MTLLLARQLPLERLITPSDNTKSGALLIRSCATLSRPPALIVGIDSSVQFLIEAKRLGKAKMTSVLRL